MLLGMGDINTLAAQIQKIEGYYLPGTPGYPNGSLAWQNNNPGNLVFANQASATKSCSSNGYCYAKFAAYDDGYAALLSQIRGQATKGQNLQQFIWQYAPPCPKAGDIPNTNGMCPDGTKGNDTSAYLQSLQTATGATPNTALTDVIGTPAGVSLPPTVPGSEINTADNAIAPPYSDSIDFWDSFTTSEDSNAPLYVGLGVAALALYAFTR